MRRNQPTWDIQALNNIIPGRSAGSIMMQGDTVIGTNGIYVKYGPTVLTADTASLNRETGDVVADGHVRIETGDQLWVGEHITYNLKTHQMQSEQFRTGMCRCSPPARNWQGNATNQTYDARHAFVTTDDIFDPTFRIRASHIRIVPGHYVEIVERGGVRGRRADVLFSVLPAQHRAAREQPEFRRRLPLPVRRVPAEQLHLVVQ